MAQSPADPDRQPPRFPYVAALLCAACLGAAGWTWMRYSYRWEVTPEDLGRASSLRSHKDWPDGAYVRIRGLQTRNWLVGETNPDCMVELPDVRILGRPRSSGDYSPPPPYRRPRVLVGRISVDDISEDASVRYQIELRQDTSRFMGASIAGLVVGAMGVFVFTLAFRDWLNRRRALSVDQAEGET